MLNRCGNRKYTRGISVNKLKRGCALGGGGGSVSFSISLAVITTPLRGQSQEIHVPFFLLN